jgi:hypothetical protein
MHADEPEPLEPFPSGAELSPSFRLSRFSIVVSGFRFSIAVSGFRFMFW